MKKISTAILLMVFAFPTFHVIAQEKDERLEKIKKELELQIVETKKMYEKRISELETRIDKLQQSNAIPDSSKVKKESGKADIDDILKELAPVQKEPPKTDEQSPQDAGIGTILQNVGNYEAQKFPWFPALLNPYIGLMIEVPARFTTQRGGYENINQINLREAELNIYSNIDPFIRGFALISGGDEASIEEAYFLTSSLPHDLQIRGGKFFANLGRLNKIHTHDLPFVDQPLTMQNFLGAPEFEEDEEIFLNYEPQFKSSGIEILWLAPTKFYWRLLGGVFNQFSDRGPESFYAQYLNIPDGFRFRNRGIRSFSYTLGSRWFFELGDDHSLRIDTYGNFDSPEKELRRTLEMIAFTYRWFPLEYGIYKGMEWTTEFYANQEKFPKIGFLPESQNTMGMYSYIDYKLNRRFSLSVLGSWSQFRFNKDATAKQMGTALSYKPSERQRIRAQMDYIDKQQWKNSISEAPGLLTTDSDFWQFVLQWTVVMGSHTHTYE